MNYELRELHEFKSGQTYITLVDYFYRQLPTVNQPSPRLRRAWPSTFFSVTLLLYSPVFNDFNGL